MDRYHTPDRPVQAEIQPVAMRFGILVLVLSILGAVIDCVDSGHGSRSQYNLPFG
jgi:hypothetical protein